MLNLLKRLSTTNVSNKFASTIYNIEKILSPEEEVCGKFMRMKTEFNIGMENALQSTRKTPTQAKNLSFKL